jgi:hypothetical protein
MRHDKPIFDGAPDSGGDPIKNVGAPVDPTDAARLVDVTDRAGGFYGVIFKETESGGAVFRDDQLNVDSNFFYLSSDGSGKPILSSVGGAGEANDAASLGGDQSIVGSPSKVGVDLQFKGLTAGTDIDFTGSDSNQITINSTASGGGGGGFYGVIFKESDPGTFVEQDDTLVFDYNHFYLQASGSDGKPLVSLKSRQDFVGIRVSQGDDDAPSFPGYSFVNDTDTGILQRFPDGSGGEDTLAVMCGSQIWAQFKQNDADLDIVNFSSQLGSETRVGIMLPQLGTIPSATLHVLGDILAENGKVEAAGFYVTDGKELLWNPSKSIAITVEGPTNTEDISWFFTDKAITITAVESVLRGSTPSVTFNITHDPDRSAAGNDVFTTDQATTSTTTGDSIDPNGDPTIPANSFVWIETSAASGTITEWNVTAFFTEDL